LVTACTLAFQVVFTRMMSSVLAYHFSFMAVSLVLLGTGAGALLVYLRPEWFDRRPLEVSLARASVAYGVGLIVTPLILVRIDYEIVAGVDKVFITKFTLACLLATLPSLAAGAVVALAIRGWAPYVGRVYAWDLIGAGLGALVIVPLLRFPAPDLLVALGVVACLAGALFAWPHRRARRRSLAVGALGIGLVVLSQVSTVLWLPMPPTGRDEATADVWHPLSRVQATAKPRSLYSLLFYDRVYAPVPNVDRDDIPDWRDLKLGPASVGYELTGPGHALIIGGGGGRDIWNALSADQTVDVIELNSAIVDVVEGPLGDVSGRPYSAPGVSTSVGDGRALLAARDTRYDQIHIGFTDTLSANAAQGFALAENNLYTIEAFEEYLDHLTPDGVLNVSRLERLVGDEAIRATVLTLAALERRGIEHPERNIAVIRGVDSIGVQRFPYETILAKLTPFTEDELRTIRVQGIHRGDGVAYVPGGPYYGAWADLAEAPSWRSFCAGYQLDICPPTDDRPFFFNMRRFVDILDEQFGYHYGVDPYQMLLLALVVLVALAVVGFVAPLWLSRSAERPELRSLGYFGALGLGFLLLETVLMQRFVLFLGFPTYALSVVLFALLMFTGIGSAIAGRLPQTRRTLTTALSVALALILVSAFTLQPLLRALIDLPFPARVVVAIALLAPVGLTLGMPMPLGLARFSRRYPDSVAYAWGVNGLASVVASVLGVALAMNLGYAVASLVAGACYAFALVHAAAGRWTAAEPPAPEEPDTTGPDEASEVTEPIPA
jgi:hypothetical protein